MIEEISKENEIKKKNFLSEFLDKIIIIYLDYLINNLLKDKTKIRLLYGKDIKNYLKNNIYLILGGYLFLFFVLFFVFILTFHWLLLILIILVLFFLLPQNVLVTVQFFIQSDFETLLEYLDKKVYLIALDMYQFMNLGDYITIFSNIVETEKDKKLKTFFEYVLFNLKQGKDLKVIFSELYKLFGTEHNISEFLRDLEIALYEGTHIQFLNSYIEGFFYTFDDKLRRYVGVLNSSLTSILTAFILINTILIFYHLIFYNLRDALQVLKLNFPSFDLLGIYMIGTFIVPPLVYLFITNMEKSLRTF